MQSHADWSNAYFQDTSTQLEDHVSSVWNRESYTVRMHVNRNYGGPVICIRSGSGTSDLGQYKYGLLPNQHFGDKTSSHSKHDAGEVCTVTI